MIKLETFELILIYHAMNWLIAYCDRKKNVKDGEGNNIKNPPMSTCRASTSDTEIINTSDIFCVSF